MTALLTALGAAAAMVAEDRTFAAIAGDFRVGQDVAIRSGGEELHIVGGS